MLLKIYLDYKLPENYTTIKKKIIEALVDCCELLLKQWCEQHF